MHQTLLIAGHRIGGPCDQAIGKEVVRNPYDNSVVGTYAEGGWSELSTALASATDAWEPWFESGRETRKMVLYRAAELVSEREAELVELAAKEIGKPVSIAALELKRAVLTLRLSADALDLPEYEAVDLGRDPRPEKYDVRVTRRPRGVVLAITPYNWPFNLTAHKLGPALAAGNSVVLKPSPNAALCTLAFADCLHDAGIPAGVLNTWCGPTPLIAKALRDPRVSYLSFTGSDSVGWSLRDAHPRLPMTLELGGNASAIITASADVPQAAREIAESAFFYSGQVCISTQIVYVHATCYEAFVKLLIEQTSGLSVGNPIEPQTRIGPMISSAAVAKVTASVEEALEGGANLLFRGESSGNLLGPIVLENLHSNCRLMTDEVFGPVLCVQKVASLSEAIDCIENGKFGLQAAIYTQDAAEITAAQQLTVGGLVVNGPPSQRFDAMPYGGRKASGLGCEGPRSAMEAMTEPMVQLFQVE